MTPARLLTTAVAEWQTAEKDPGYLLLGTRLDQFELWAEDTTVALTVDEQAFLAASIAARQQRQAEETARQQRELETAQQLANQQLLDVLTKARDDATHLVATPGSLLESQPALRKLKDGLLDAQLRTSRELSSKSPLHPAVLAAQEEEQDVRRRLHGELEVAMRGLTIELEANAGRIALLEGQLAALQDRLGKLASIRAEYETLSLEVKQRNQTWNQSQEELSNAQAAQAASHAASLLTRLDAPQTGAQPGGPSRSMILLASIAGGLLLGLGVSVLTATPVRSPDDQALASAEESPARSPWAIEFPLGRFSSPLREAWKSLHRGDAEEASA